MKTMAERYRELQLALPAEPQYLAQVRRLVRTLALDAGASNIQADDMVLAVNEACSNVAVHAYGENGGPLHVHAWEEPGRVVFEVSDNGTPVADPTASAGAGLGLHLINKVCDDVDIEGPGPYGTRLEMTFFLATVR